MTGDDSAGVSEALKSSEGIEYATFQHEGQLHRMFQFFCGDTVVGGVCTGETDKELVIEISDGQFSANDEEYEEIATQLQELISPDDADDDADSEAGTSIDGKTICFTGTLTVKRREAEAAAVAAGAKVCCLCLWQTRE